MSWTSTDVFNNVRDHIDEPSASFWSDSEVYRAIDRGTKAIFRHILTNCRKYFERSESVTFAAGTNDYPLTNDVYQIESIRCVTSGYGQIEFRQQNSNSAGFLRGMNPDIVVTNPDMFLFDVVGAKTLRFSPTPQSAIVLTVNSVESLPVITGSGQTFGDIPDAFLTYVGYHAADQLLHKQPGYNGKWGGLAKEELPTIYSLAHKRILTVPELVQGFGED